MNDTKQPEALRLADALDSRREPSATHYINEAAAELRRLHQVDVAHGWWLDKTEWVQESSEASDLGRHRADVMRQRIERLHAENEVLHDQCLKSVMVISVLEDEIEAMRSAVHKLHAAKGRYHTQIAACDLYDLLGLKSERPTK